LGLFDGGVIISYQHQALKPEPAIYQILLARLQPRFPEQCVFIDDSLANLSRGQRVWD
jgi:HAD superfamily hydrolase (TIGR01509 family)